MTTKNTNPTRKERLEKRLQETFRPLKIEVIDESALHEGHAGWRPEGETHFRIQMVAEVFSDKNRVERARLVHTCLEEEFARGLHALSLSLFGTEIAKKD